jgi:ParB/RepB/Spo0J family partition protein
MAESEAASAPPTNDDLLEVSIDKLAIGRNIRAPDPEQLQELTSSIKEVGVLEPVLVARREKGLELVAGFRRVAAARRAGLKVVPAHVLDVTPTEIVEIQLTENLQRQDLTELEEARAFKDYVDAGHTQGELAKRIGKSQPYVANRIRLLGLPEPIAQNLESGKLSPSHAEVFLQLPKEATPTEIHDLLDRTVRDGESVRELARRVGWKAGTIRDRVKRKKARDSAIAGSRFPICPVKGCGGKGQPDISYNGSVGPTFSDRSGHTWSRKNGALIRSRPQSETRRTVEPAKPTLPLVDGNVPCPLTPDDLWQSFYSDSTLGIERFHVQVRGAKLHVSLSVISNRAHPTSLPDFSLGRKPGFVEMVGGYEYAQQTDAARRRLAGQRAALEQWFAQLAGKNPRAKAVGKRSKK